MELSIGMKMKLTKLGECWVTEGGKAIQQVEHQRHHVDGDHDQNPEGVAKRLQERHQGRRFRLLPPDMDHATFQWNAKNSWLMEHNFSAPWWPTRRNTQGSHRVRCYFHSQRYELHFIGSCRWGYCGASSGHFSFLRNFTCQTNGKWKQSDSPRNALWVHGDSGKRWAANSRKPAVPRIDFREFAAD